jgi:hypothetical protein
MVHINVEGSCLLKGVGCESWDSKSVAIMIELLWHQLLTKVRVELYVYDINAINIQTRIYLELEMLIY